VSCQVTREEEGFYEHQSKAAVYGVPGLDRRVTATVACEACRLLEQNGLIDKASPMLRRWFERHQNERHGQWLNWHE
jgi:hypothetical protein